MTRTTLQPAASTDLLFDYDSANLRPGATASLQKLGRLIQRNPQAVFRVEGHTDSFGSDQYNMDLSQRRAETVKGWLVANMSIDSDRVQTCALPIFLVMTARSCAQT